MRYAGDPERSYATLTHACKHDFAGWLYGTEAERKAEFERLKRTVCEDCADLKAMAA